MKRNGFLAVALLAGLACAGLAVAESHAPSADEYVSAQVVTSIDVAPVLDVEALPGEIVLQPFPLEQNGQFVLSHADLTAADFDPALHPSLIEVSAWPSTGVDLHAAREPRPPDDLAIALIDL